MDNYDFFVYLIIALLNSIVQVFSNFKTNANIKRRIKRMESSYNQRGNDLLAQKLYAMASGTNFGGIESGVLEKDRRDNGKEEPTIKNPRRNRGSSITNDSPIKNPKFTEGTDTEVEEEEEKK